MELHRPRCRKPASRNPSRGDQGTERLASHLFAAARIREPGKVGVLSRDSVVVVVGDQLGELVGTFPGDRLDPRAYLRMRLRPARLR